MRINQSFNNDIYEQNIDKILYSVKDNTFNSMDEFSKKKFEDQVFGKLLYDNISCDFFKDIARETFFIKYDFILNNISPTYEGIINLCKAVWGNTTEIEYTFDFLTNVPAEIKFHVKTSGVSEFEWVDQVGENIVDENGDLLLFSESQVIIEFERIINLIKKIVPQSWIVTGTFEII